MARLPATTTTSQGPGTLGHGADQELWSCPSNPTGLVRRPSQPWACPPGSPRQDRSSITPCLALVTPFRSPFVTPETQPAHRGAVTERGPHTTGLAGPFLLQEKIPTSPSLDQGQDPWGDQESVNRPAAVGLETTAPPPSVIRIQQGLGQRANSPGEPVSWTRYSQPGVTLFTRARPESKYRSM